MAPWERGKRHQSWASNGNISVYIFGVLFTAWFFFQVWSREGGGPPPTGLDAMVMTALGIAVTSKSVEKKNEQRDDRDRITKLEDVAKKTHPRVADKIIKGIQEQMDGGDGEDNAAVSSGE